MLAILLRNWVDCLDRLGHARRLELIAGMTAPCRWPPSVARLASFVSVVDELGKEQVLAAIERVSAEGWRDRAATIDTIQAIVEDAKFS
jgi:hypothetical protein